MIDGTTKRFAITRNTKCEKCKAMVSRVEQVKIYATIAEVKE